EPGGPATAEPIPGTMQTCETLRGGGAHGTSSWVMIGGAGDSMKRDFRSARLSWARRARKGERQLGQMTEGSRAETRGSDGREIQSSQGQLSVKFRETRV